MSNNKFKVLFLAFVFAGSSMVSAQGLSSMKAHDKLGVTCEQCHGTKAPMAARMRSSVWPVTPIAEDIIAEQN